MGYGGLSEGCWRVGEVSDTPGIGEEYPPRPVVPAGGAADSRSAGPEGSQGAAERRSAQKANNLERWVRVRGSVCSGWAIELNSVTYPINDFLGDDLGIGCQLTPTRIRSIGPFPARKRPSGVRWIGRYVPWPMDKMIELRWLMGVTERRNAFRCDSAMSKKCLDAFLMNLIVVGSSRYL
ncbi:hypothetical protein EVAR_96479_1 [Eumeta japonica]|uniref:Uncharacterized protein n=1 Tax=Eumeta variegata TaxID=151549 RepID=A0A4C1VW18_EUMVA|nr:hypothetical protein EVAR_96479_1 [Eumeta japonica]